MTKNYYSLLGVSTNATPDEIKAGYRKMAMKYHPDRCADNPEYSERFKEISNAYDVLKDPAKRQRYDQFGPEGENMHQQGYGGASTSDFSHAFEDIIFGGGVKNSKKPNQTTQYGDNIAVKISISLEECYAGCNKSIRYARRKKCQACRGLGGLGNPRVCSKCKGRGTINMLFFTADCDFCGGAGHHYDSVCRSCRGQGSHTTNTSMNLKIEPGFDENTIVSIKEQGHEGAIKNGSLKVHIDVEKHAVWQKDGKNLTAEVNIDLYTACIGGTIRIPILLDDSVDLSIKPGTQNGQKYIIYNRGIKYANKKDRGKLCVITKVQIPQLSQNAKEVFHGIQKELQDTSGASKGVLSQIKDWFFQ